MIIITGDSWSCGEWSDSSHSINHKGLEQYLLDYQYTVINLGRSGDSNFGSYLRLLNFLESGISRYTEPVTHVLLFQTEWHRDYKPYYNLSNNQQNICTTWDFPNMPNSLQEINDLVNWTISNWQYRLVDLAQKYKLQIGLIGGASDTIWIDNFAQEYPGLKVLCQSMTNLCINNTHRIDKPIHNVNGALIDVFKNSLRNIKDREALLADMDSILFRLDQWRINKKYFWPDGVHANRLGHKQLFDFIMESEFLKTQYEL